jgi:hypothetical protein
MKTFMHIAKKLMLFVVFLIGLAAASIYGFAGLAAFADASQECPNGNQCGDAIRMVCVSLIVVTIGFGVGLLSIRSILRAV